VRTVATLARRLHRRSPDTTDRLIACGVGLLAVAEWVMQVDSRYFTGPGSAFALLVPLALVWRRRAPLAATLGALLALTAVVATAGVVNWTTVPLSLILLGYAVGTVADDWPRTAAAAACSVWAAVIVAVDPSTTSTSGALLGVSLFFVAPVLAGRGLQIRAEDHAEASANAGRIEREQAERSRQAAAEERVRVARELHDVLAHSVSVMVIQTEAARAVAARTPAAAIEALASVEAAGRDALVEMRRTVGVLRQDSGGSADGPTPGLADLPRLAERAREAGLPVEVAVRGEVRRLPAGLELAGYRVAQEAITNAIKHAGPASARIEVEYAAERLCIGVTDTGRGPVEGRELDAGHGLVGMRERVSLYGGTLTTGPAGTRGFAVHAQIPVGAEAA
jgi:signal transduction histidine kinase